MRFPFAEHKGPIKIPPVAYLKACARIIAHRTMPLRWSLMMSVWEARLRMRLEPERREHIQGFLKDFLPSETSREQLERAACLSLAIRRIGVRTYAPVWRRSREWLLHHFRPEGLGQLEELKRSGGGAILLGTGMGLKLWVEPILRQLGYRLHSLQRKGVTAQALLLMRWEGVASEIAPYARGGESAVYMKKLHDLVKQGEWVRHVGQDSAHDNPVKGRLRSVEATSGRGPWLIARATGAPLIPVVVLMDADFRCRLVVDQPIHVAGQGSAASAIEAAFQSYLDVIKRHLLRVPWNFMGASSWLKMAATP